MKLHQTIGSSLTAVLACAALSAQAQTLYYKTNNNDALDQASSWTNGVVTFSAPGSLDTAIWDANVTAAANCTNTMSTSPTWGGIQILNPPATVRIQTNGSATPTLNIGSLGIDLNEPGTTSDLALAFNVTTVADQNWVIASGRTLTVGDTNRNVVIQNNVGANGHIQYVNNVRILGVSPGAPGTLYVTNSATLIEPSASALTSAQILVGYNGNGGNVYQTAGTVKIKRADGTSGSPNAGFVIASQSSAVGSYTITGGSLTDTASGNVSYFAVANGANSVGTLNVDGTGSIQAVGLRLGNQNAAVATVNLTNGTMVFSGTGSAGEIDIGRVTTAGQVPGPATLNVYGGTFSASGNVMVPHGNGPGYLKVSGGAVNIGGALNVTDSSATNVGMMTISGGSVTVTNTLNLPSSSSSTASGTVNLNGGTLTLNSVAHPGTSPGTLVFNGGTLRARQNSTTFIAGGVTVNVGAGGAIIDNNGFNLTIPAALLNGGGMDGGLTKLNTGTLTLLGANSYSGPTTVNAGSLYLYTTNFGGGSLAVSNVALLHVISGSAGSTLNCSALTLGTLGASLGGALTNEFDLDGFASPGTPFINTPSLSAAGTVYVNIFGSGLSANTTYHLIHYTSNIGGSDYSFTANLISGAVGYVTNNTATHYVDLVVTTLPSLVWRAQLNTNWDTTTANWVDLSSGFQTTYPNGASVLFDDSTSNGLVYATAAWSPALATINNPTTNYNFTGIGKISGVTGLTKLGGGSVTMGLTNDYSGDTLISNGTFKVGSNNVIPDGTGKGDLTLEGKLDLNGFSEAVNGLTGANGVIDNSGGGAVVFTMGNGGGSGSFGGLVTNSTGSLALTISGGNFVLLGKNGYSGGTTNRGSLQLAYEQSIGTGPLALQGSLLWTDTAAHTLTNPLTLTGGATFGATTNGPLTVPGTVNLAGGNRTLTCNPDALFQNGATNGGFSGKAGLGTLTVKNFAGPDWVGGSFALNNGTFALDNALGIEDGNNFRIQCNVINGFSRLVLTNGATLVVSNSPTSNFRFGDGGAADVTNQLDLAGTLNVIAYPGSNNKFQMGSASDPSGYNIVNLLPGGVLLARQITDLAPSSASIFNFDGGTLKPNTNDLSATFMQGLDSCNLLDRGAIIDTAGFDISIGQGIQAGGTGVGALTKQGAGMLRLNGNNSYTGSTLVNGGGLGGIGSVNGPVTVASGGSLTAGAANTSIGSFGIFNNLTLSSGSFTILKVNRDTGQSDQLYGMNTFHAGGTLVVNNLSSTPFAPGDVFFIFGASSYTGAFASIVLPPLPGTLAWNTSRMLVDGSIQVVLRPVFTSIVQNGGSLVFGGTNGTPFADFYVLSSTNVALPLASWHRFATNAFDDQGNFNFTNAVSPSVPQTFYSLQAP